MAWRFKKLSTKGEALSLIATWSIVFYWLAGLQVVVASVLFLLSIGGTGGVRPYMRLPTDAVFNYLGTAGIVALLTYLVQELYSRIGAVLLLALSVAILFTGLAYKSQGYISGNMYFALVAIWGAARLTASLLPGSARPTVRQ